MIKKPYIILFLLLITARVASATTPLILYTDVESGPNSGGESNNGAYLSIFGRGFGNDINNISITIGGGAVAQKKYLGTSFGRTDIQQLTVQLGASTVTGAIKVTVGGVDSNIDKIFTVRPGNIYFVNGQNTGTCSGNGAGTFTDPWTNPNCAVNSTNIVAGDIVYFRAGTYSSTWGYGGVSAVFTFRDALQGGSSANGTVSSPIAFLGYPGEDVYIKADTGASPTSGLRLYYAPDYYVFAGFRISGYTNAFAGGSKNDSGNNAIGTRLINNNMTGLLAQSSGGSSVVIPGKHNIKILGNKIHGSRSAGNLDHAIYLQACSNDTEVAWNYLYDNNYETGASLSLNYEGTGASGNCSNGLTTSGTVNAGSTTMTLSSATYIAPFSYLSISGAGTSGGSLRVQVSSKSGNDVVFSPATITTVTNAAVKEVAGTATFHNNYFDCNAFPARAIYVFEQYYRTGDASPYPTSIIYNNIFDTCGYPTNNGAINLQNGNFEIYNNTIYNSRSYPLFVAISGTLGVQANIPSLIWKNNISTVQTGILYQQNPMAASVYSFTCDYNLFYGNGTYSGACGHSISDNPLFVGGTPYSLEIALNSPAKDAGTSTVNGVVTYDYLGISRPQNSIYDIGTYEYDYGNPPVLPTYTIGGTVLDLIGTVVLQNNGGDNKMITVNGTYAFPTSMVTGSAYSVTILTQPVNQICTVSNGNGTVGGANVTNVNISCGYLVTVIAGAHGNVNPAQRIVPPGTITTFTIMPDSGYFATVVGTCGGYLAGTIYTTDVINAPCSATASFSALSGVVGYGQRGGRWQGGWHK